MGRQGVTSSSFRNAVLVIFVFVVGAFITVAWRTETLDHDAQVRSYDYCKGRQVNITRTNHLYRELIKIERDNPFKNTSPETIARRIKLYQEAILTSPDCGPKP